MDDRALSHTVQAWQYLLMTRRRKLLPTPIFGICSVANVQEPFPLYSWMLMGGGGDILCLELGGTRESCLYVFRYGTILLPEREGETFDNIKLESHSSSRGACS
jgi:hypothetical protein